MEPFKKKILAEVKTQDNNLLADEGLTPEERNIESLFFTAVLASKQGGQACSGPPRARLTALGSSVEAVHSAEGRLGPIFSFKAVKKIFGQIVSLEKFSYKTFIARNIPSDMNFFRT
ncbi:hypothetical protein IEQ34_006157 [Dendrobium chrysotoxum]|uniref:Uncharacterized protein n=1 Tax=Dendrobium chrysotoxum TaxID=161865 RepID=A0AAV7HE66_DENCH|nr:hypothetical protein IEQ34_006157 [Dendrobium chrysotoxum]